MSKYTSFLAGCTTMAATLAAVFALTGGKSGDHHARFDEITVGRINIEEPDGTKRMTISNRAQFPGAFEDGKEIPRPDRRDFAGMLFIDEQGNENGGFIQRGMEGPDGKIKAGLSLTFDRFKKDQALQLLHTNDEKNASSVLKINDMPSYKEISMEEHTQAMAKARTMSMDERAAFFKTLNDQGKLSNNRVILGTTPGKASALMLSDTKGRVRMSLVVSAEGIPEIKMFDENGKAVKTVGLNN